MRQEQGYVLAIDEGTTGATALLLDRSGQIVSRGYREIRQFFPRPGWVEHDPEQIWEATLGAVAEARQAAGVAGEAIVAIGITNQRETVVVWDAQTGRPIDRAIVWQCRRTASTCDELRSRGLEPMIRAKTGLVIDPYFSATKVRWLLDQAPDRRERAASGALRFGTVDSWLIWKLTGGKVHVTDYSNASRTLLYNVFDLRWDPDLLELFAVPAPLLPRVVPSSGVVGATVASGPIDAGVPIAGVAGDQQAALFGQTCYVPGMAKTTWGTGSFLLMNTGTRPVRSSGGLLTTLAWGIDDVVEYALEGSVFVAGAVVQWLRDGLGLLSNASESDGVARSVPDTGGVYFVPAFVGLGAPYWDPHARGTIVGLTRGSGRAQLVRAGLEAVAYQTRDVVDLMAAEAQLSLAELRVDGGAAANDFLCQFQADILGVPVVRPRYVETTGLGAAYLAGLAVGFWQSRDEILALWQVDRRFTPEMEGAQRDHLYRGWHRAVERAARWDEPS